METWALWECLKAKNQLTALIALQRELDLQTDTYKDLESLSEINHLIREKPSYKENKRGMQRV